MVELSRSTPGQPGAGVTEPIAAEAAAQVAAEAAATAEAMVQVASIAATRVADKATQTAEVAASVASLAIAQVASEAAVTAQAMVQVASAAATRAVEKATRTAEAAADVASRAAAEVVAEASAIAEAMVIAASAAADAADVARRTVAEAISAEAAARLAMAETAAELAAELARRKEAEARLLARASAEKTLTAAYEARDQLAAIIDSSSEAIMSATIDGVITTWNASAEKLFGFSEAEAIGRQTSILFPPGTEDELGTIRATFLRDEVMEPYDTVRRHRDGHDIEVSISPSVIRAPSGSVVGGSMVAHDISARRQTERALTTSIHETATASREYEAFAYAVAHDLRGPLRAIDGFTRAAQSEFDAGQPETARARLDRVRASAKHMNTLIASLLRLAEITHRVLINSPVDLTALAWSATDAQQEAEPDRAVGTTIQSGMLATGDPSLLGIAIANLISNAWKFTQHEPHAQVDVGRDREGYFVTDNGAGFDPAHAAKLFGLFQRLHTQSEFEGTGIGLVSTQRIIRRHGGRIWANGAPDRGATFHFTLDDVPKVPGASQ